MRNGPYVLIVAPDNYPGKKYRGRYAYEHIIEFWKKTGRLPLPGYVVHHDNDDKHDNSWGNLEEKQKGKHSSDHNSARAKLIHGTLNAYSHWGCRCEECRIKNRNYVNEYRWRTGRRKKRNSPVAQLAEQRPVKAKVEGANPSW